MLAVFNWTNAPRSHSFPWSDLKLPAGHHVEASDVLDHNNPVAISEESVELRDQPPHSVRLIKLVDTAVTAEPPSLTINAPSSAEVAKPLTASVSCAPEGVPAFAYHWDFGDGTSAEGPQTTHTYTRPGNYSIKISAEGADGIPANRTVSITVTGTLDSQYHLKNNRRYVEPAGQ
jgi:PKD repeat protein